MTDSGTSLLLLAVIIGAVIFWKQWSTWEEQKKQRAQEELAAERDRLLREITEQEKFLLCRDVRKETQKHLPTVMRKHRQTVRQDEYGRTVMRDWSRELVYFLDQVLLEEFVARSAAVGLPVQGEGSIPDMLTRKYRDVVLMSIHDHVLEAMKQEATSGTEVVFGEQMPAPISSDVALMN